MARPATASKAARTTKRRDSDWARRALLVLVGVALLREGVNALGLIPVHFDEAQYWAYGEAFDFGYYSKPPLAAWVIRLSTQLFGDTSFGLRVASPLCHLWIGWLIFATGRRLFDGRTGFWAAAGYTAAPGVTFSALLISTDPVMMVGWALGLYGLVRAMEHPAKRGPAWVWWALAGLGLGAGMLAKYTAIAFGLGALGYGLFSRSGRADWRGAAVMAAVALAVLSPNLVWNAAHGFATVTHLSENASYDGRFFNPGQLAEFFGVQFGVIGPVFFAAILTALVSLRWRGDWRLALLTWLTAPLILAMCLQALIAHANANWAAPAYVGGSVLAAWMLLRLDWIRALKVQLGFGVVAAIGYYGLAIAYAGDGALSLPRLYDPYKKMRVGPEFCEHALTAMEAEGVDVLLSNNRRRLSECLWEGRLRIADIAVWNPDGAAQNHYELVASLGPGDDRPMILAEGDEDTAAEIARHFDSAEELDAGAFPTHADREAGYSIWLVQGFQGYR